MEASISDIKPCRSNPQMLPIEPSVERLAKPAQGTVFSSYSVMAKTMIGSGVLGLACATSNCGWVLGLSLLFISAVMALFTLHLLNILSMRSKTRHVSYYTFAEAAAPWSRWVVDVAIAIKCLGVATSYLQASSTFFAKAIVIWAPSWDQEDIRRVCVAVITLLIAPVCYRKRLNKTTIVNLMGIIGLTYAVILAIIYAKFEASTNMWPVSAVAVLAQLPVFIFAFTCHQNMFLVAEDMKDRSQKKLDLVAFLAEATSLVIYLPALIFPYLTYGDSVSSNFVTSFTATDNIPVQIGLMLLGVAELCAFPLQVFPCRKSMLVMLTNGQVMISPRKEVFYRRILTSVIILFTMTLALITGNLGPTLKIVGIVGSNTICFIMPTFLFICLVRKAEKAKKAKEGANKEDAVVVAVHDDEDDETIVPLEFDQEGCVTKWKYYFSCFICGLSILLVPICLSAAIYTMVNPTNNTSSGH